MTNRRSASWRDSISPFLGLFGSMGTLFCCALPALLVSLGFGASLAGLIGVMPWITVVSKHKAWLFIGSGLLLVLSAILLWRARHAPCPLDPRQAQLCAVLRRLNWWVLGCGFLLYFIGFYFAFIAIYLL
ncbi:MAG: hypothetical protein O3A01_05995 [bacterium]|nr:hypothetical protein [bacterium]